MDLKNKLLARLYIKKNTWIAAVFVALLTLIIFLPALQNGFVNWDDHSYASENQNIRSLGLSFFRWVITSVVAALWHPLTMFSLALDYAVWGLNPLGYHLTNVLIHSLNTFLVFILILHLIKRFTIAGHAPKSNLFNKESTRIIAALLTALLFGVHPMHVESVAWISERKDVLCSFFLLLSVLTYLRYTSANALRKPLFYTASLIFFIIAIMSKPMAVTLPVVLLILDFYPLDRLAKGFRRILAEKIPFFALSLLSALLTVWAHQSKNAIVEEALGSVEPLLFTAHVVVRAYVFYLTRIFFPFNLSPFYPGIDTIDPFSFGYAEYIVSFALLLFITYIALRLLKKNRLYPAVWFYYIVTLIPVIGIVPVGAHFAADRYTYLPSLGPFLLLGIGTGYIFARSSKKKQALLITVLLLFFGVLTYKTITQISAWENSVTLWARVIKLFPYSTKAYLNRGGAYAGMGNLQQAIKDMDMAVRLNPASLDAYKSRGNVYKKLGDSHKAIRDYSKAIELAALENGGSKQAAGIYINRGVTKMEMEEYRSAIEDFNEAIKLDPGYIEAYNLRGAAYVNIGEYSQAVKDYDIAIQLDPGLSEAYYNRGTTYRALGENHKAVNDFSMAIKLNPQYAKAYNNRGNAYRDLGSYRQAIEDYGTAIKLNPEDALAYRNRGIAYRSLGNDEQALRDLNKAGELNRD